MLGTLISCQKDDSKSKEKYYVSMKINGKDWIAKEHGRHGAIGYLNSGKYGITIIANNTNKQDSLGAFLLTFEDIMQPLENRTYNKESGKLFASLQKYGVDSNSFDLGFSNGYRFPEPLPFSVTLTKMVNGDQQDSWYVSGKFEGKMIDEQSGEIITITEGEFNYTGHDQ